MIKKFAALIVGLCVLAGGLFAQSADPFGKLPTLTTVTGSKIAEPWMNFGPGKTYQNNWWTDAYKEKLNIDLQWSLTGGFGTYDTVFQPALATGQLPDMIFTLQANEGEQLIKRADKLVQPWDDALAKWASPQLKAIMAFNKGEAMNAWKVKGKTYGLASPMAAPAAQFLWIRADWLAKAKLKAPTNLAELEKIMDTFIKNNYGNATNPYGIAPDGAAMTLVSGLFRTALGWQDAMERNGKLMPLAIEPEQKAAWAKLAQWYSKGYLAKDYFTKKDEDTTSDFQTGKVGIQIGSTNWPDGSVGSNFKKANKDVEVIAVPLFGATSKGPLWVRGAGYTNVLWLNKTATPDKVEAIVKMLNLKLAAFSYSANKPAWALDPSVYDNGPDAQVFWSVFLIGPDDPVSEAAKKADYVKFANPRVALDKIPAPIRVDVKKFYDWADKGTSDENYVDNWKFFTMGSEKGTWVTEANMRAKNPERFYTTPYWGNGTETSVKQAANLSSKFNELLTKAVVENAVEKSYADWTEFFNTNGGKKSFEEMNAAYVALKASR